MPGVSVTFPGATIPPPSFPIRLPILPFKLGGPRFVGPSRGDFPENFASFSGPSKPSPLKGEKFLDLGEELQKVFLFRQERLANKKEAKPNLLDLIEEKESKLTRKATRLTKKVETLDDLLNQEAGLRKIKRAQDLRRKFGEDKHLGTRDVRPELKEVLAKEKVFFDLFKKKFSTLEKRAGKERFQDIRKSQDLRALITDLQRVVRRKETIGTDLRLRRATKLEQQVAKKKVKRFTKRRKRVLGRLSAGRKS